MDKSMNETLQAIAKRYTCRAYDGAPVDKDTLEAIAMAGAQAPTAVNGQRFRIIMVSDKALVDEMEKVALAYLQEHDPEASQRAASRGGKVFYDASAMMIVLISHEGRWSPELDAGIVVENMAIAATALGVASGINAMAYASLAGDGGSGLRARLQVPEGFEFAIALLLGYAKEAGQAHEPATDKIIRV